MQGDALVKSPCVVFAFRTFSDGYTPLQVYIAFGLVEAAVN